jgi:hypothetical protein
VIERCRRRVCCVFHYSMPLPVRMGSFIAGLEAAALFHSEQLAQN